MKKDFPQVSGSKTTRTRGKYTQLFVFYRDGHPVHIHSDRKVFEDWMQSSKWLYPAHRCEIVRFVPAAHDLARPDIGGLCGN